jgi:hypothetical protein
MRKKQNTLSDIETARLVLDQILPFFSVSFLKSLFSNAVTGIFNIIAMKIPIKIGESIFIINDSIDNDLSMLFIIPNRTIEITAMPSHFK